MEIERSFLLHEYRYRCTERLQPAAQVPSLYEIYYHHEGEGELFIGDRSVPLAPGVLVVSDGTKQLHIGGGETACIYTRMSIRPSAARTLEATVNGIDLLLPFKLLGYFHVQLTDEARAESEQVLRRIDTFYGSMDWVDINRLVMAFFDLLVLVYAGCEPEMKKLNYTLSDKERNVRNMIAYIETAINEDVSLKEMEKELHLSKQYMSKIFREVTGMTIFDYLYRRRIEQAKRLLRLQAERSITEVCLQVGFKNVSHFSRMFKTQVGLSPERYRSEANRNQIQSNGEGMTLP